MIFSIYLSIIYPYIHLSSFSMMRVIVIMNSISVLWFIQNKKRNKRNFFPHTVFSDPPPSHKTRWRERGGGGVWKWKLMTLFIWVSNLAIKSNSLFMQHGFYSFIRNMESKLHHIVLLFLLKGLSNVFPFIKWHVQFIKVPFNPWLFKDFREIQGFLSENWFFSFRVSLWKCRETEKKESLRI